MPAVRRLLRCALTILHVDRQAGADLEIALTEACANVVSHAAGADRYEVHLDVGEDVCAIDVVDNGSGFDPTDAGASAPDPDLDRGRGLYLIRALSDNVRLDTRPRQGCLVHFEKRLSYPGPQAAC